MNLVDLVNKLHENPNVTKFPDFRTGDTVSVHVKIKDGEGDKFRVQVYEGICIAMKEKNKMNGHFRVRKISSGVGVERIFPFHSTNIEKIEVILRGKSRRAKHYYLRDRTGKAAKISTDYSRS